MPAPIFIGTALAPGDWNAGQVARFGNRVFLIDTGISSVYRADGGRPSALEIRDGIYTAVYLDSRTVLYDGH